jgi:hypothetical protein
MGMGIGIGIGTCEKRVKRGKKKENYISLPDKLRAPVRRAAPSQVQSRCISPAPAPAPAPPCLRPTAYPHCFDFHASSSASVQLGLQLFHSHSTCQPVRRGAFVDSCRASNHSAQVSISTTTPTFEKKDGMRAFVQNG